jgi:peptide/nickel transport system substrate-binding protein
MQLPTRREFGVLLAGSLLAARRAGAEAVALPKSGGDLEVAFDGAAVVRFVLDPHNSGFAPHNRVMRSIFDNLVVLQDDQSVGPWLATSWEIAPDQKTYTFKLRTDVTFHDGTRFDAAAVKANLDRIANPKNALIAAPEIGPYLGSEIVADDTLRILLSEPFAPLLHNLSMTKLAIISPTAAAKAGDAVGENPVGTGPFRFVSLTQGTDIKLERNRDYRWAPAGAAHSGPAYLDTLIFRNVPEQSTRIAALQSGQVQAADLIPSQNILAIKSDAAYRLLQQELLNTNYALFPNVAKAPWNDLEIRQALRLGLDIDTIVRIVYLGTLKRAWSPLSPSIFASAERELAGSWKPDPKRAVEILDQKGWVPGPSGIRVKDGNRLTISFIDTQGNREQRLDVVQLVRRQLLKIGIDLTIDSEPAGNYLQKIGDGAYDLVGGAQFAPDPDVLRRFFVADGRSKASGLKVDDPELTAALQGAAREGDPAKRTELYRSAQRLVIDKVYAIPIYVLLYNIAAAASVNGIGLDAHGFPEFRDAWLSTV